MTRDNAIASPLPHNRDAERAFLGAILLGSGGPAEIGLLESSEFYIPFHRVIHRHLKKLAGEGKPTNDTVLLYESLSAESELEAAGGLAYVSPLADGIPRVANIPHYVEIIKTQAALRRSAFAAQGILEMVANANGDAAEVLQRIAILSAPLGKGLEQKAKSLPFESADEAVGDCKEVEWLVKGYVAQGAITLLSAKIKGGKTTLATHLVKAVLNERPFLGAPTKQTPVVYLTEQPRTSFKVALQRADLTNEENIRFLYFNKTIGTPWAVVAAAAAEECKRMGAALLIVDTFTKFAGLDGDAENNSGAVREAVRPLNAITGDGIGVLIMHHDRKSGGEVEDATRGSSALPGEADVILSMRRREGNGRKSLRVLQSRSRFSETPDELVIDLTDDGYIALGQSADVALDEARDAIFGALSTSEADAMTLKEVCEAAKITRPSGQRALTEMVAKGAALKSGAGKRGDPFRYSLPEKVSAQTTSIYGQKETNPDFDARLPLSWVSKS